MNKALEIILLILAIPVSVCIVAFITTWLQDKYGKESIEDSLENPYIWSMWTFVYFIICASISVALIWKILIIMIK